MVDKLQSSAIMKTSLNRMENDMTQTKKNVNAYFYFFSQGFYFSVG